MRWSVWWLISSAMALAAIACSSGAGPLEGPPSTSPILSVDTPDGGSPDTGGNGGPGGPGGTPPHGPEAPIEFPGTSGWQFFGPQNGGPRQVFGVTADGAGNIWVAGGEDGLFVLTPGATEFKRFTRADGLNGYADATGSHGYDVISVAGGPGSTVFVGYRGIGISDTDPMWELKSGDADKVVWNGATLSVRHFDISTPPGVDPHYPQGREKIRTIYRIVYDARTGNVWFGGDHGVALYEARGNRIWEHQHAAINGYKQTRAEDPEGKSYTLISGDWPGVALDAAGDVWIGGGPRVALLKYGSEGGNFWADMDCGPFSASPTCVHFQGMPPALDVWPDAVAGDARPEERTDDVVSDLLVDGDGSLWVGSLNGLARLRPTGTQFYPPGLMVNPKVTALERDPKNGSIWIGHLWGGVTRIVNGSTQWFSLNEFGRTLIDGIVSDIQSDVRNGQRRILVAFSSGAIGVYTGP